MMTHKIPLMPLEIKKPTIPFTKIPNPFGTAHIYHENGYVQMVPLYYLQMMVRTIVKVIAAPFVKLHRKRIMKKYQKMQCFKLRHGTDPILYAATVGATASGKTAELDIQSLINEAEKSGRKVKVFDIKDTPKNYTTFNPFADMYDILGEERKPFIEKLSEIAEFAIIEEDNVHT